MARRALFGVAGVGIVATIAEIVLTEVYGHHTGMLLVAIAALGFSFAMLFIHEKEGEGEGQ